MSGARRFASAMIVGGGGAVGSLFLEALVAAGVPSVVVVDRRPPPAALRFGVSLQDDIVDPGPATLDRIRSCDLLILATPEPVAIDALPTLLPAMKHGSLLVDTLSVKSRYAAALSALETQAELLGVNPMFAPSLGFAGRSVVAVPYRGGELADAFMDFVAAQGSDVVRLGAEAHDRACAALQVATHASVLAFGMSLAASGYDLAAAERIMPPPHRTLLALLARIVGADPEVYRDIQAANPYAVDARSALADALRRLEDVVATEQPEPFHRLVADLRALLAHGSTDYAALCARLFEVDPRD